MIAGRTQTTAMTPEQLARARKRLGLSLEAMATMLGYEGTNARSQVHHMETGRRPIREPQRWLVELYISGARPPDWPSSPPDPGPERAALRAYNREYARRRRDKRRSIITIDEK